MTTDLYQVCVYSFDKLVFDSLIKSNNKKLVLWYLYRLYYDENREDKYEMFIFLKIKYLLENNPTTIQVCYSELILKYKSLFYVCLFMTANDLLSLEQLWNWTTEYNCIYDKNRIEINQRLIFDIDTRSFENISEKFKTKTVTADLTDEQKLKLKDDHINENILKTRSKLNVPTNVIPRYTSKNPISNIRFSNSKTVSDILARYTSQSSVSSTLRLPKILTRQQRPRIVRMSNSKSPKNQPLPPTLRLPKTLTHPQRPRIVRISNTKNYRSVPKSPKKPQPAMRVLTTKDYIRNYNKRKTFAPVKLGPLRRPPSPPRKSTSPDSLSNKKKKK